jgi:apolipoprotein N-acyltransferase
MNDTLSREPALPWHRRLLLCAVGGLLGAASFPLAFPLLGQRRELFASGILEPLAFICLVPVLIATRTKRPRGAFGWGLVAGMFFFTGAFWWVNVAMTTFGGMPNFLSIPALLLLVAWCAFHWGIAFWLARAFWVWHRWPVGLTFAPIWMATELMRNYFCSGFPWANLGYSQMRNLWLSQTGSLWGVYGVAALIAFVNGALFELVRARRFKERSIPKRLLIAAAALLVLGHVYGAIRVKVWDDRMATGPTAKIGVVQGNIDQRLKNQQGQRARTVLEAYNAPTSAADDAGADLIVWPEASFPLAFERGARRVPSAQENRGFGLGKEQYGAHLLLGVDVFDRANLRHGNENAAYLVSPNREVVYQYTKYHLVPFGEYVLFNLDKYLPIDNLVPGTFMPGTKLEVLSVPLRDREGDVKVGVEICFDAIFPEISRSYARDGAQLLVNLTNDAWYGFSSAPYQFLRMVAMRAVETGVPVARAANTGISAFIDPVGRIRQPTPLGLVNSAADKLDANLRVPPEWRVDALPIAQGTTVYVFIGDVPAYLAALFCVAGLAFGFVQRRRTRAGAQAKP